MSETIIACKMIEDEVKEAMARVGSTSQLIFLDRGLHEYPANLKNEIQRTLQGIKTDYILFAYGLCGNAMDGIFSPYSTLVIPRFHDCIQMMMVKDNLVRLSICPNCLYYTDGWFNSDKTMLKQYEEFAGRKGEVKAQRAYRRMLQHYDHICLIDTVNEIRLSSIQSAEETGRLFDLELRRERGSISVLERLFSHDWDENFVICGPGEQITQSMFLEGESAVYTAGNSPCNS